MKKAIAAAARQMDSSYGRGDMAYSDDEDLPGTIHVIPNRVIDMNTLVMEIRRFIADIGRVSMALPPANKETRKKVHDLAEAFGLKSKSKGKGDARYTTLTRTSRTGYAVSERKIGKIVRGAGGHGGMFGSSSYGGEKGKKGKGGGAPVRVPRHREGEEVGGVSDEVHAMTRSRALTTFVDRAEDWRVQRRLQDVGDDGVAGWPTDWCVWRIGCADCGHHEDDEAWPRGDKLVSLLFSLQL